MSQITAPGVKDRSVFIGPTGSGKSVLAAFFLGLQNFQVRPWVCLDYKREELWDAVGDPPMRPLKLGQMPGKNGLYRMMVRPDQDEEMEDWLWSVWNRGEVGLFADEVSLLPKRGAFKAILRQGRSLHIPVIACTQRPVDCDREVFSESQYRALFGVEHVDDWKVIKGLFGNGEIDITKDLPEHCSYWYDRKQRKCFRLKPCPHPDIVAASLRRAAPYSWWLGA